MQKIKLLILRTKSKIYNLLRWSEKYAKTDMVYLTKGNFWLTISQISSSAASFILVIVFARLISKETYGTYKYILSIAGILTIPTLSGLNSSLTQAIARGYEGSIFPVLKTRIRWGLLGSIAGLSLSAGYYFGLPQIHLFDIFGKSIALGIGVNHNLSFAFLIVAVFTPFADVFNIYNCLLQGKKLFDVSTKYEIISQIIAVLSLTATVVFTKNIFFILLAYFLPWTITRLFFFLITVKKIKTNSLQDPQTIPYGKHLSLINVVGIIASFLDRPLLFHYLGAAEVAIYSIAIAPSEQIKTFFSNVPILAMPKLAQRTIKEINSILYKRLLTLFLAGMAIAGAYIVLAPYFFKIFFPKYMDSVLFSQIFSLTLAIRLPLALLGAATQSRLTSIPKKTLYWANTIPPIILITSLLLFSKPFGITGVVVSRIFFLTSSFTATFIVWKKITQIEISKH